MLQRIKIAPSTKPFVFVGGELEFEEGSPHLVKQDVATRLTLQTLSERLLHELECPYCREDVDPKTPVVIDDSSKEGWED